MSTLASSNYSLHKLCKHVWIHQWQKQAMWVGRLFKWHTSWFSARQNKIHLFSYVTWVRWNKKTIVKEPWFDENPNAVREFRLHILEFSTNALIIMERSSLNKFLTLTWIWSRHHYAGTEQAETVFTTRFFCNNWDNSRRENELSERPKGEARMHISISYMHSAMGGGAMLEDQSRSVQ